MQTSVFRKSSLDRLSSPEQLDELMRVTTPKGWVVLFALLALIGVAVVWGILGRVSVTVEGQGILMKSGGILNVQHIAGGMIKEIKVKSGDVVHQGDVVARVNQIEIVNRINETRIKLKELESKHARTKQYSEEDLELQKRYLRQQELNILATIQSDQEQLKFLAEKVKAFEDLEKKGGISKQQVVETKSQYESLKQKIADNQNRLKELQLKKLEVSKSKEMERTTSDSEIDETRRSLELLEQELVLKSDVVSPYTGRVIEVMVNEGTMINPGTPLLSLEPVGRGIKNLEAVVFVPSEGRNLKPGMEVQVSPSGVKKEEFGFILGRVTRVSEYPASSQGMMRVLGNESLVKSLAEQGPVIGVNVDLVPSSKTTSGFRWSSPGGPPITIQSGTVCSAKIIERKQRPISLVIPKIKEFLGI
jgi:HlyD family secretion protein